MNGLRLKTSAWCMNWTAGLMNKTSALISALLKNDRIFVIFSERSWQIFAIGSTNSINVQIIDLFYNLPSKYNVF